jgi:hypothetical protein
MEDGEIRGMGGLLLSELGATLLEVGTGSGSLTCLCTSRARKKASMRRRRVPRELA